MNGEFGTSPREKGCAVRTLQYFQCRRKGRNTYYGVVVVAAEVTAEGGMKSAIGECALLLMAVAVWTEPALARSYLNCLTKKVVIVDAQSGNTSSSIEENLGFWIDEASKSVVFADGTPFTVRRFDDRWISAAHGDVFYELDRQNGNLTYAGSTAKDGTGTMIIGSGRCTIAADPAG
jgi:hypothetical protein